MKNSPFIDFDALIRMKFWYRYRHRYLHPSHPPAIDVFESVKSSFTAPTTLA